MRPYLHGKTVIFVGLLKVNNNNNNNESKLVTLQCYWNWNWNWIWTILEFPCVWIGNMMVSPLYSNYNKIINKLAWIIYVRRRKQSNRTANQLNQLVLCCCAIDSFVTKRIICVLTWCLPRTKQPANIHKHVTFNNGPSNSTHTYHRWYSLSFSPWLEN